MYDDNMVHVHHISWVEGSNAGENKIVIDTLSIRSHYSQYKEQIPLQLKVLIDGRAMSGISYSTL